MTVAAVLLLVGSLGLARAAITGDEINSLPGWTGPFPSKQYSGQCGGDLAFATL